MDTLFFKLGDPKKTILQFKKHLNIILYFILFVKPESLKRHDFSKGGTIIAVFFFFWIIKQ